MINIDDILLMAESREMALEKGLALFYLLKGLGFTLNVEKTVSQLTQTIQFLGFSVNTLMMEISLSPVKLKTFRADSPTLKTDWQNECGKSGHAVGVGVY